VREVWGSNPELIKSLIRSTTHTRCKLDVWAQAQSRRVGHHSLVTPERVLSEYNEDLIFMYIC